MSFPPRRLSPPVVNVAVMRDCAGSKTGKAKSNRRRCTVFFILEQGATTTPGVEQSAHASCKVFLILEQGATAKTGHELDSLVALPKNLWERRQPTM